MSENSDMNPFLQALLLGQLRLRFHKETTLNPDTLLPDSDPAAPLHHCLEVISQTCLVRPDLTDVPLPEPDKVLFTDGSSYVKDGIRYVGAAVVSQTGDIRWAQALPRSSFAQKAELVALTQALRIGKDKTIYTDSRYAFATVHVHGEIYKNRGLLTSEGKAIKNKEQILALLEAIWDPKAVAIIHCRGHQKDMSPKAIGNQAADQAARKAALRPVGPIDIMTTQLLEYLPDTPTYTEEERQSFPSQQARLQPDGWYQTLDSRLCLPKALGRQLLARLHQLTHLGACKLGELVRSKFRIPDLTAIPQGITSRCLACAKSLQALQTLQTELRPIIQAAQPDRGPLQPHLFLPGDTILFQRIPSKTLQPTWKGPYIVTLTTPTAFKVARISAWIHHMQVKLAPPDPEERWKVLSKPCDQKIRLGRVPC
ncbi:uncharacterized protein RBU33_011304 [Hipposideros larvatus]